MNEKSLQKSTVQKSTETENRIDRFLVPVIQKRERMTNMDNINFHDMFPPDPNKETVTEEMHPEEKWFAEAGKMDEEGLPDFYARIIHGYNHDYGTACHAVSACALAAAWAACNDMGLTGLQAGFVMWDFIMHWMKTSNKCGLKLVDYDDFLYPQYEYKHEKTISSETWVAIQEQAKKNLEKPDCASDRVINHWKKIVEGYVPFGYQVVDRL